MPKINNSSEIVSVIIPTFNRLYKTSRAIDSCLIQTYNEIQVIVVNDGGDSSEFEKLQSQYQQESRVSFFSIEHTGHPGKVRNAGIQQSSGTWIAFLDSDDSWEPRKLEIQISAARAKNARAICSNALKGETNSLFLTEMRPRILTIYDLLRENYIVTSSVLISRKLLDECGGIVEKNNALGAEDYATWLRISSKVDWCYLPVGLVRYETNSKDSLRFSANVPQIFSQTYGVLNFLEWQKIQNKVSLRLTRFILLLIPTLLKLDLFFSRSKKLGKESNLQE